MAKPQRTPAVGAEQHQAAFAHRHRPIALDLQAEDGAATQSIVGVGRAERPLANGGQPAPGAGQGAGLQSWKSAAPARAARPRHVLPGAAAVGRGKQAGGILVGAVAGRQAALVVEKVNAIQAGQGIGGQPLPFAAAVAGDEHDADAAAAAAAPRGRPPSR